MHAANKDPSQGEISFSLSLSLLSEKSSVDFSLDYLVGLLWGDLVAFREVACLRYVNKVDWLICIYNWWHDHVVTCHLCGNQRSLDHCPIVG